MNSQFCQICAIDFFSVKNKFEHWVDAVKEISHRDLASEEGMQIPYLSAPALQCAKSPRHLGMVCFSVFADGWKPCPRKHSPVTLLLGNQHMWLKGKLS